MGGGSGVLELRFMRERRTRGVVRAAERRLVGTGKADWQIEIVGDGEGSSQ